MLKRLVAAALPMVLAASTALAGDQDFRLKNRTGYVISEVYVSSSKTADWEEDVMGRDVLGDGEYVDIEFTRAAKGCAYDLMVIYDDGTEAIWDGLNLCTISVISLRYDPDTGRTWATTD